MNEVLSVGDLNRAVNETLTRDPLLSRVRVRGEISGLKKYPSGHIYFTLKDFEAAVSCVLFKGAAGNIRIALSDGMRVVLFARPSLYDKTGRFQLIVNGVQEEGIGDLYTRFLLLREKLENEGLFDVKRKKPIPFIPERIVAVTSSAGAVIRDIIHVVRRRFPGMRLLLIPVAVQGAGAETEIASAIQTANRLKLGDVIIVGRGGGSLEDLQPFNEELTARAIAASSIPIISAVGHETDYTIADFAADLRAPTPSAAAELAVPVKETLYNRIEQLTASLEQSAANRLENADRRLASLSGRSVFVRPVSIVERHEAKLALLNQRFLNVNFNRTSRSETRTSKLIERHLVAGRQLMLKRIARYEMLSKALIALSPLAVLTRGYAAVRRPSGEMVSSAAVLSKDDVVDIVFSDGEAGAKIIRPFVG